MSGPATPAPPAPRYAWYVLGVLILVYVLNFLDRQILSILAEKIRADLQIDDAQLGFLYGTAFAVFYALFGIPLGRLADTWNRTRLISIGLAFWSVMTAMSGLARGFSDLAWARVGVGIGEASASPAAYSLLADYFPASRRATVLGIYQGGMLIGTGLGLGLGGMVVNRWDLAWTGVAPPFGLRGWQVAFFVVGIPGLLLSLWTRTLREPRRGQSDGLPEMPLHPHPFRETGRELRSVMPPLPPLHLWLAGAGGAAVAWNLVFAAIVAALAWGMTTWLGNPVQWIALAVGLYVGASWAQSVGRRDPVAGALILRTPAVRFAALEFAFLAAAQYGLNFWVAPFFIRLHHVPEAQAGPMLGMIHAGGGIVGVTLGGILADRWHARDPRGRLFVTFLAATLPVPLAIWMLTTADTTVAYMVYLPMSVVATLWSGPAVTTIQELVLPRMRGTASAAYLLLVTLVGLALGPYAIGRLSGALGDLRLAMLCGLGANAVALAFGVIAARLLPEAQATLQARATAAGEPGLATR